MSKKSKDTLEKVKNYYEDFIKTFGYSPTYSMAAKNLNMSKATVGNSVNYLVNHGKLIKPKWGVIKINEKDI